MPPFRPANLNKKAYPGNANVIGPTVATTLGISTTTCTSTASVCDGCTNNINVLGCRCTFCGRLCCCATCSCPCTVCTPTVPSGMWSVSEQYEASTRGAWGNTTATAGIATLTSACNYGCVSVGAVAQIDCKGFLVCCDATTSNRWFVAPSCTQVSRCWCNQLNDAVTLSNFCMGACGWFIASRAQALAGLYYPCRTYWDSYEVTDYWTSHTQNGWPVWISMSTGCWNDSPFMGYSLKCIRAFRCTTS